MESRRENSKTVLNMALALCSQCAALLSGLIVQRYILLTFGSSINGLTAAIAQFLAYLTLMEAGLSTASIQALYKPLTEDDKVGVNQVLAATHRQFIKVGLLFLVGVVCMTASMPMVIGDEVAVGIVVLLTLMSGLGSVFNYIFLSKNKALLHADNRVYVIYLINVVAIFTMALLKLSIIFYLPYRPTNIIYIGAVTLAVTIGKIIAQNMYVSVKYRGLIDKNVDPDMRTIGKRWSVTVHQLVGLLHNNSDTVLLTMLSSLKTVSVYSVYNYIFANVNSLMQTVFLQAVIGRLGKLYSQNRESFRQYYEAYELIYTCLMLSVMTGVLIMTIPFISLYTADVTDVQYVDYGIALLFYIAVTLSLVRLPSVLAVTISGHFKETQKGAILEAVINIFVSIPMLLLFNIKGVLLGTIIAMLWRTYDLTAYSYKNIVKKRMRHYYGMISVSGLAAVICVYFSEVFHVNASSWPMLFLVGAIVVVLNIIVFMLVNALFYWRRSIKLIELITGKD